MAQVYNWRCTYFVVNSAGKRIAGPLSADIQAAPRQFTVSSWTLGSMTENHPPSAATVASVITSNGLVGVPSGASIDVEKIVSAQSATVYS
jgi:hypothetical protein